MRDLHSNGEPSRKRRSKRKKSGADAEGLSDAAAELGVNTLPPVTAAAGPPVVDPRAPIGILAAELGRCLRKGNIFRRGGDVVTVDEATGAVDLVTPVAFPSMAEESVVFARTDGERFTVTSVSAELSAKVLAARQFKRELRELRGVNTVALPVWANAEQTAIRFLEPGYDDSTGFFTIDTLPYDRDGCPDTARRWLMEVYAEFPWGEGGALEENRSFGVHMAAHFAVYARLLLLSGPRPAFLYNANQPGSGKTMLAKMALAPVFGPVAGQSMPKDEAELGKQLATAAMEGRPYLFFDNIAARLSSAALENFLTSPLVSGRVLSQSRGFTAPNMAQLFLTANSATTSPDMARRVLAVDLFCRVEAVSRKFARLITEAWLFRDETRREFLEAMAVLTRFWSEQGCPRSTGHTLASFEDFSAIVGGFCQTCRFADPVQPGDVVTDETSQAWRLLLTGLSEGVPSGESHAYTVDELIARAEELEILDLLTGMAKDPRKSFGQRLRKWKGRVFTGRDGREFTFGNRRQNSGQTYVVHVAADSKPAAGDGA